MREFKSRIRQNCRSEGIGLRTWLLVMLLCLIFLGSVNFYSTKSRYLEEMKRMNQQTLNHINGIMDQMDCFGQQLQNDMYLKQLLKQYEGAESEKNAKLIENEIEGYLNEQKVNFYIINMVALLLDDGTAFANVGSVLDFEQIKQSDWYEDFQSREYMRYYSVMMDITGNTQAENKDHFMVAFPYKSGECSGSILFGYPFTVMLETVKEYQRDGISILFLGRDNRILYRNMENGKTGLMKKR